MGNVPGHSDMKLLIALSTLLALSFASSLRYDEVRFAQSKEQFGKQYHTRSEHHRRFNIFSENLKKYEEHNKSGASWTMGVNQFSDFTEAEFEAYHMGGYKKTPIVTSSMEGLTVKRAKDLPESVDWRDKGAVSEVKDQGSCGPSWATLTSSSSATWLRTTGPTPAATVASPETASTTTTGCHLWWGWPATTLSLPTTRTP